MSSVKIQKAPVVKQPPGTVDIIGLTMDEAHRLLALVGQTCDVLSPLYHQLYTQLGECKYMVCNINGKRDVPVLDVCANNYKEAMARWDTASNEFLASIAGR